MTTPSQGRPYAQLVDGGELSLIESAIPGGAALVLGMIKSDMEWIQKQTELENERRHTTRLLSIWLTIGTVLIIAGLSAAVIIAGHGVPGTILASTDLVALATVLVNSWKD